jgi:hypothetical protein
MARDDRVCVGDCMCFSFFCPFPVTNSMLLAPKYKQGSLKVGIPAQRAREKELVGKRVE